MFEKLELHAEHLARTHEISPARTAGVSLRRRLRAAFRALNTGNQKGVAVTPAAAWPVDNFYIVDDHIKAVRRDLPAGFYKERPNLATGVLRGYPRVYGVVTGLVAHSDNRFDLETFIALLPCVSARTTPQHWRTVGDRHHFARGAH